jgi:two-component system, NtrC family, response regulator HydG
MHPKLIITGGPMRGTVFALTEQEVSVGREPSNSLYLPDRSVSRQHCLLRRAADEYHLIDLDSFNGTLVNGVLITQHPLEHRDQIAIGDVCLLFLLREDDSTLTINSVEWENSSLVSGSTIRLHREEALYLNPDQLSSDLPKTSRVARDLNTLLKISTIINSTRNLVQLQEQLLELIFEAVPAERGAILLVGAGPDDLFSLIGWDRHSNLKGPVRVSRTITSQVLHDGVSILSNEIQESNSLKAAESLIASQTKSLLCVPLNLFGSVTGAIYLDTSDSAVEFDEEHLQLSTAIASIAAIALENALHVEWLENENRQLEAEAQLKHNMIGKSSAMRKVFQVLARVAPTDLTVLIRGESGTGKELAAQAVHLNSARADKPFVAINCAAFAESLFESEFFGHERGAFTGAHAQKIGLIELAHGGTVFLDEIGELTMPSQAKILRVLETQEFRRVGGTATLKADVRLVAATNRNLQEAIKEKSFREDLYYRLNIISLQMPPLRERRDDIVVLANHFNLEFSKKYQRTITKLSPEVRARLVNYTWPGNVRELRNMIERAVVMGIDDLLATEFMPAIDTEQQGGEEHRPQNIYEAVKDAQKQAIIKAFEQANGNYTETANILGVHPTHLHRLIRTLNMKSILNRT